MGIPVESVQTHILTYEELLAQLRRAEQLLTGLDSEPFPEVAGALCSARASLEQLLEMRTGELQRLGTAIECAAESIIITAADGAIAYVNPAFELVTGYSRTEVLGKQPRILKSGRHDEAFYRSMWATLLAGDVWQGRITNRRKDGSFFEEVATISSIRDSAGGITGFVGVKRDVTRETQLEAQLRQAQKMEAVGRLAGGVAHDFNNILTVINGYSDLALAKMPGDDPLRGYLSEIRAAGERAATLTRQLLAFSRRQNTRPQRLDLNAVVESAARMFTRMTGGRSAINLVLEPGTLPVMADEAQMHQVLMNLVTNALDAMPGGGVIGISTSRATKAHLQLRDKDAQSGYAKLSISDTGEGMSEETLAHIFEPFFTTKEVGKGTGLGLPTVQGIVEERGGWIDVESRPGSGSRFDIFLPLALPGDVAGRTELGQAVPGRGGPETILLVDDQKDVRRFVSAVLKDYGYFVLEAGSPSEAARREREWRGSIDLLLTDFIMPGMNGRQLAMLLQERRPAMKVMYLTGHATEILRQEEDSHDLLHKPFTPEALAAKVRKVLG